jgi:two-component system, cell cycle sensor histidine kinase and response regulator CckA
MTIASCSVEPNQSGKNIHGNREIFLKIFESLFMTKPINVLVIEDSENDTALLIEELRDKGYDPDHRRVESAEDLQIAIRQRNWDVVVSDYTMPRFNGSEALKLFTELKLDIPFIFVSGTHGEEAAVRMMKAGASDYIVKGNLSRFVPAIEREMESAQSRRAQIRAEAAMNHLAAIVNSSQDAIYSMNLNSSIISWNPAAERIYGYSADEIIGRSIATLFPLSRRDELLESMTHVRLGEMVGTYETERKRKDGGVIPICLTISPIKNAGGKVIGASVIARDISKQKQEEHDHLKLIAELTEALGQAKTLTGLLPICATCKRIRDEKNSWSQVETYIARRSNAIFTHGICPECSNKLQPEIRMS